MADKKISALTAAALPLAGSEVLPIVQSGVTVKVSVDDLTAGKLVNTGAIISGGTGKDRVVIEPQNAGSGALLISTNAAGNAYTPIAFDGAYTKFNVTGTEVARTNSNGIAPVAGKGIDFSANTHAAGMTSELLNDYEEGTWTPTDGSGAGLTFTGTSGNCFYTKVGNLVTCVFGLVYPTTANTSGAKLAGLPFTSKATTSSVSGGFITYTNSSLAIAPLVGTNDTGVNLFLNTGNAAGNNQLSTFILRGIITYMV
jgi:hypothetical protein